MKQYIFKYSKDTIVRILLFSIAFIEILILPLLLAREDYGDYEYFKNLILLSPLLMFGAQGGFVYQFYNLKKNYFEELLYVGLALSTFICALICIYSGKYLLVIPCVCTTLYIVIEQKLKVEKHFILAFTFKPLLSASALLAVFIYTYPSVNVAIDYQILLLFVFVISMVVWLGIIWCNVDKSWFQSFDYGNCNWKSYLKLISCTFYSFLTTICLSGFLFLERHAIASVFPEYLATYSLGFNLVQLLIVVLTSIGYLSVNLIGENMEKLNRKVFRKSLFLLAFLQVFLLVGLLLVSSVLTRFLFTDFEGLTLIVGIIGFSKGALFLVAIFTPLLVFRDRQRQMLVCIFILLILSVILWKWVAVSGVSKIVYLVTNGALLLLFPLWNLYLLNACIRNE